MYYQKHTKNCMLGRWSSILEPAQDEIEGLVKSGFCTVFWKKDIPSGRGFEITHSKRNQERRTRKYSINFKFRLIIQGHRDPMRNEIGAEAPTVLRSSTQLILSLSRAYQYPIWTRDVKQAFIQSAYPLGRPLFIKTPSLPYLMSMVGYP